MSAPTARRESVTISRTVRASAHVARRRPARGRPIVVDLLAVATGLGLGATIALGIEAETPEALSTLPGVLTAAGRMTGLLSGYAMVVTVALSARIPPLERALGQDRLIRWHRRLGPWGLYLLLAHVVLIVLGYAGLAGTGVLAQLWDLVLTYPGMLAAAAAALLLAMAGVTSYRRARRRFAYETWWAIHLYTYLALLLAFSHQVDTGASFVGHPMERAWWTALWVGLLVVVIAFRLGLPAWRSLRHGIRVAGVERIADGVWSVTLRGRKLDRLPVAGGQFFQWRFLERGLWWQAHPYSLSHVPQADHMRITVKDLGDHSSGLGRLRVGTAVAVEGPYGVFTADAAPRTDVLLIGAGVGATPLHALLQDLDEQRRVTVLLRATTPAELVLRDEIATEVRRCGGTLYEVTGPRSAVRIDATTLGRAVPAIAEHDVFVCGPDAFTASVLAAAREAGVPERHLHHESFAF